VDRGRGRRVRDGGQLAAVGVSRASWRWALFAVPFVVLYAMAMSGDVYDATSPPSLGAAHVLLRKLYSIIAFAVVGATYGYARRGVRVLDAACAVALYSGCIEIGQWFVSEEPLAWNLFDTGCGFVGGALGAALLNRLGADRVK
jgi:hypothetical protein